MSVGPPTPTAPVAPARPWRTTFRALRHANYRLFFVGQAVSLIGTLLQSTAQTWLAFVLTHSSTWAAAVTAAGILPAFFLAPLGGSLADRWSRRHLIIATQAALLAQALALAAVTALGAATPWVLLGFALASGAIVAIDLPARLAFVCEMVGRDDLVNAIGLNSLQFNVARAVGPALGGLLVPLLGPALCFFCNGLSYVAVLLALFAMPPTAYAPPPAKGGRPLRDGLRFVAERRGLLLLFGLTLFMAGCGWPVQALLPALAKGLGHEVGGYGLLLSGVGVGAMAAALAVASFGSLPRRRLFLGGGVLLAALSLLGLARSQTLAEAWACCCGAGAGLILFFATAQAVTQLTAGDHNRGVVMGVWSMVLSLGLPVGNLAFGAVADARGTAEALVIMAGGILASAAAVLALVLWGRARTTE
jgi:MFS family permease